MAYTDKLMVGFTVKGVIVWKIPTNSENPPRSTCDLPSAGDLQTTILISPEIEPTYTNIHGLSFDPRQVFGYNTTVSAAAIMSQGDLNRLQYSSSFTYDCTEGGRLQNCRAVPLQKFTLDFPPPPGTVSSDDPEPPQARVTLMSKSPPIPVTTSSALKASVLSGDHMLTIIESPGQPDVKWAYSPIIPSGNKNTDNVDSRWRIASFEVEREWQKQGTPCVCSGRMVYADKPWGDIYVVDLLIDRQAGS
jgi:hypothetical protein